MLRHWVGECALDADQCRSAEGQARRGDALALHAATPVHQVGNANQYLLGVAPAQLAGSPEGVVVDYGHAPAGLTPGIGYALGGRTGAPYNHINGWCYHTRSPGSVPEVPARTCLAD